MLRATQLCPLRNTFPLFPECLPPSSRTLANPNSLPLIYQPLCLEVSPQVIAQLHDLVKAVGESN